MAISEGVRPAAPRPAPKKPQVSRRSFLRTAWLAGLGFICAVSAPSSLAIDLADEAGITLLGFARGGGFNLYTHPARLPDV